MKNFLKKIFIRSPKGYPSEPKGRTLKPELPRSDLENSVTSAQRAGNLGTGAIGESKSADRCPYCSSSGFVKRGIRKKKFEVVQLYLCRACSRTFTAQSIKGKKFPLNVIMGGLTFYNLGYNLEESCRAMNQKFGINPGASTLAGWVDEYSELCRYSRLRPYAVKMCAPHDTVETVTLAHRQLYRFRYHRSKLQLIIEEQFKNSRFGPLGDYLDSVAAETPHQYFQEGERMSEVKTKFDKAQMIVHGKQNYANRLAEFVLQGVRENKMRHERLQMFMVANDSVTVATEVPVYIRKEDIEHMENVLKFKIIGEDGFMVKGDKRPEGNATSEVSSAQRAGNIGTGAEKQFPRLLTGHIDILQVRNGQVHILDFKPNAAKEKPIEQLTWYALALSRLTGLRLYEFKCGWFDEKDYFEFYPLHVVKKISDRKRKNKIYLKNKGVAVEIPKEDKLKVV